LSERYETQAEKFKPSMGRMEGRAITFALNSSHILRQRCPEDFVFKITGRFFVFDFEERVRERCVSSANRMATLIVQNPSWSPHTPPGQPRNRSKHWDHGRWESQVTGFRSDSAHPLLKWALKPIDQNQTQYTRSQIGFELHIRALIDRLVRARRANAVCQLPSLPILPVFEGTSHMYRKDL